MVQDNSANNVKGNNKNIITVNQRVADILNDFAN